MAKEVLLFPLTKKVKKFLTNTLVSLPNVTSLARTSISPFSVMTDKIMTTWIGCLATLIYIWKKANHR